MTDVLTKEQRSYNMSQIRGRDTKPELLLRKYLFSNGLKGYRVRSRLPGKPDIVFTRYKIAVFVDGCFWHRCPRCFVKPTSNITFWEKKIDGNVRRDKEINKTLRKQGWKVIRFWEHEIKKDLQRCYSRIEKEINKKP